MHSVWEIESRCVCTICAYIHIPVYFLYTCSWMCVYIQMYSSSNNNNKNVCSSDSNKHSFLPQWYQCLHFVLMSIFTDNQQKSRGQTPSHDRAARLGVCLLMIPKDITL